MRESIPNELQAIRQHPHNNRMQSDAAKPRRWCRALGGRRMTIRISSQRTFLAVAAVIGWPDLAIADGGISALGAMLPVFFVLGTLGIGLAIWLFFSLGMLISAPVSMKTTNIYQFYSVSLICVILVAAVIGSAFLSVLVLFAAIFTCAATGGISAAILSFLRKRASDT